MRENIVSICDWERGAWKKYWCGSNIRRYGMDWIRLYEDSAMRIRTDGPHRSNAKFTFLSDVGRAVCVSYRSPISTSVSKRGS